MRGRVIAVLAISVAALLGSACGGDDDPSMTAEAPSDTAASNSAAEGERNDADVSFAKQMIPHHQQAIEMAMMAAEKAGSREVLELAARIETAQQPEIDTMQTWLEEWDEKTSESGMEMGDPDPEMTALESASGAAFDRMFLEMMIGHHESAIEMAKTEVRDGAYAPAIELAQQIIDDQEAEIAEMRRLLEQVEG